MLWVSRVLHWCIGTFWDILGRPETVGRNLTPSAALFRPLWTRLKMAMRREATGLEQRNFKFSGRGSHRRSQCSQRNGTSWEDSGTIIHIGRDKPTQPTMDETRYWCRPEQINRNAMDVEAIMLWLRPVLTLPYCSLQAEFLDLVDAMQYFDAVAKWLAGGRPWPQAGLRQRTLRMWR